MGEKIYTFEDREDSIIECVFLLIRSEKSKIHFEVVAHKKMEYHNLQTFHWHYKAYVYTTDDATHCCSYFSVFLMLDHVELNHKGQQYILVQNNLNNMHFTSLSQ